MFASLLSSARITSTCLINTFQRPSIVHSFVLSCLRPPILFDGLCDTCFCHSLVAGVLPPEELILLSCWNSSGHVVTVNAPPQSTWPYVLDRTSCHGTRRCQ